MKKQIKKKPIRYIVPKLDECTICGQPYDPQTSIAECQTCHQQLHSDCQIEWYITQHRNDEPITCPYCRSIWVSNQYVLYPMMENGLSSHCC